MNDRVANKYNYKDSEGGDGGNDGGSGCGSGCGCVLLINRRVSSF